jgi:hypothetical protein
MLKVDIWPTTPPVKVLDITFPVKVIAKFEYPPALNMGVELKVRRSTAPMGICTLLTSVVHTPLLSNARTIVQLFGAGLTVGGSANPKGHANVYPPVPFWQISKMTSCPLWPPVIVLDVTFPVRVRGNIPKPLALNTGVALKVRLATAVEREVNAPLDGDVPPIGVLLMVELVTTALLMAVPLSVPPVMVGLVIVAPLMVPFRNASPGTLSTVQSSEPLEQFVPPAL